jgi:hypothetical protein
LAPKGAFADEVKKALEAPPGTAPKIKRPRKKIAAPSQPKTGKFTAVPQKAPPPKPAAPRPAAPAPAKKPPAPAPKKSR